VTAAGERRGGALIWRHLSKATLAHGILPAVARRLSLSKPGAAGVWRRLQRGGGGDRLAAAAWKDGKAIRRQFTVA